MPHPLAFEAFHFGMSSSRLLSHNFKNQSSYSLTRHALSLTCFRFPLLRLQQQLPQTKTPTSQPPGVSKIQTSVYCCLKKSFAWTANCLIFRASPSQVCEPGRHRRNVNDVARTARSTYFTCNKSKAACALKYLLEATGSRHKLESYPPTTCIR